MMADLHCDCNIFESCEICEERNKAKPKLTKKDLERIFIVADKWLTDNQEKNERRIYETILNKLKHK